MHAACAKTELFTRVVAGLGHDKTDGAVMLGTAHSAQSTEHRAQSTEHNAQRTTHNAQRTTHGVYLHGDCCYGIAAGTAAEAEGCPAACSAAACPHTMQVSAWWSWCNPGALEGDSAAPPSVGGRRPLWSHANRRVRCPALAPRLGARNSSPVVRHARQPGWRSGRGGKPPDRQTGAV